MAFGKLNFLSPENGEGRGNYEMSLELGLLLLQH